MTLPFCAQQPLCISDVTNDRNGITFKTTTKQKHSSYSLDIWSCSLETDVSKSLEKRDAAILCQAASLYQ